MRDKSFAKLVQSRKGRVLEVMQRWGDMQEVTLQSACNEDWLFAVHEPFNSLIEALGSTDANQDAKARLALAEMVAACEEWAKAIEKVGVR